MQYLKGNCFIPVSHGHLEAIYRPRVDDALQVALLLHPHPLHGGTMHNKVVYRVAAALEETGFETLRFNFRGVGQSTGAHDHGVGETDDARDALDFLLQQQPRAREVLVAGFSFGSIVGLQLGCQDLRVDRLIAIGVPVRLGSTEILAKCHQPTLFLHGEVDDIAPLAPLTQLLNSVEGSRPFHLVTISGAGHFFDHQSAELKAAVSDFARSDNWQRKV